VGRRETRKTQERLAKSAVEGELLLKVDLDSSVIDDWWITNALQASKK